MVTLILAAGYGTRLYPLTLDKPKALLNVGGKTILNRIVDKVIEIEECKKIIIVTNDRFFSDFEKWRRQENLSPETEIINDKTVSNETRLGAIGDIKLVMEKKKIDEDLFILGSDNLFKFDLMKFVKFAYEKKPANSIVLFDVKNRELAKRYGICVLDKNRRVTKFEEKPRSPKSTLAAAAMYFISKEKISKIFEYMATDLSKDAPGNFIRWLALNDEVYGYIMKETWYDIGDIESLKKADEEFTRKGE